MKTKYTFIPKPSELRSEFSLVDEQEALDWIEHEILPKLPRLLTNKYVDLGTTPKDQDLCNRIKYILGSRGYLMEEHKIFKKPLFPKIRLIPKMSFGELSCFVFFMGGVTSSTVCVVLATSINPWLCIPAIFWGIMCIIGVIHGPCARDFNN